MLQSRWSRLVRQVALGSVVAVLVTGAPASLHAQDDEENSIWNIERRVWNGLMRGVGLRSPDDPVIEYRERSPLVVPPSRDLPPPQTNKAAKNPAWPVDPDAARARKRAEQKRKTPVDASRIVDNAGTPISPSELNAPGAVTGSTTRSNAPPPGTDPDGRPVAPSELGYFGGLFSFRAFGFGANQTEIGTFTNEPARN